MKSKLRFVAGVLSVVFLLCGAAAADVVYTVVDDNYVSGSLGIIDAALEAAPTYIPTTGDPAVFSFLDGEKTRVALVEHDSSGIGGGDVVTIYDPDGGWTESTPPSSRWGIRATNIHGMEMRNDKLYSACYGLLPKNQPGAIAVTSISDYQMTSQSYEYEYKSGDYLPHAEKVLFFNENFYALFSLVSSDFSYGGSKVVKLDGDLKFIDEFDVGENAADMVVWDGKIAVAYMGGYQDSTTAGGINVIDLSEEDSGKAVTDLELGSDSGEIPSLCTADSALYFIGLKYDENYKSQGTLYKWTGTGKEEVRKGDLSSKFTYQVVYDFAINALVAAFGDKVAVLGLDGTEKKIFDNVALEGNIYSLAVVAKASAPGSSNGGGGCSTGLTAFSALLLVLPLALRKKSR
jgi:Synergist-CTERM protein sorting domain-containing protein